MTLTSPLETKIMKYLKRYLAQVPVEQGNAAAIAYLSSLDYLTEKSPHIAESIRLELIKQRKQLKLIASENYSSLAVQLAMGNLLTDKYAEGYAGHRFYAGCEQVDACEMRAMEQIKEIFGCEHAYVQPHSGVDANLVAIWSLLVDRIQSPRLEALGKKRLDELSDQEYETIRQELVNSKLLGMSLDAGGHLTHGFRHNVSSKMMRAFNYSLDPQTEQLDYQAIRNQAKEVKPDILIAGYSAYSRRINFAKMKEIADEVGAALLVDMAHFAGLVAGKVFQGEEDPVPYADMVTSTTHKTLRGPRGGFLMCKKRYAETVNKGCPLVLGGPLPHVIAAKAVAFEEANTAQFQTYARQVVDNARTLADHFLSSGAHVISKGTDNHMLVLDVSSFGLSGRQAEKALLDCGICLNRNAILNDPKGAWYTSGVRIGTAALTTLGMKESEMKQVAQIILDVLNHAQPANHPKTQKPSLAHYTLDEKAQKRLQAQVLELLNKHPLYPEIKGLEDDEA